MFSTALRTRLAYKTGYVQIARRLNGGSTTQLPPEHTSKTTAAPNDSTIHRKLHSGMDQLSAAELFALTNCADPETARFASMQMYARLVADEREKKEEKEFLRDACIVVCVLAGVFIGVVRFATKQVEQDIRRFYDCASLERRL